MRRQPAPAELAYQLATRDYLPEIVEEEHQATLRLLGCPTIDDCLQDDQEANPTIEAFLRSYSPSARGRQ